MQVSVEATGTLERKITVEIPAASIESEVNKRLQQLARTTRVKGFRPGKVPMKIVVQRYGQEVKSEVLGDLVQSSFYQAVAQENLSPAGHPSIEPAAGYSGEGFQYVATVEVIPEIELQPLSGAKLSRTTADVTAEDVDKMMDTLRKQRTTWVAVERPAAEGDRVVVDFVGTINGEEFGGNRGQQVPVTIGGQRMIAGFEEGLVGASAGSELTLDLSFPADYGNKELAGKPVQFAVTVSAVEAAELPELDEAFAASFGIAEGGVEALRVEVEKNMARELKAKLEGNTKQAVMDLLLELNAVEVPKALIDQEADALLKQMKEQMYTPPGKDGLALNPGMFAEQAKRRVSLGLLLAEIIKSTELKPDAERVRAKLEELAASYAEPDEVVKWYSSDRKRLAEIESVTLEDQVVDWVLQQTQVEDVISSFSEVMNAGH